MDSLFNVEDGPETCPICKESCPTAEISNLNDKIRCSRCGPYEITSTASAVLRHEENRDSWVQLSGWCRDQQISGLVPLIDSFLITQSHEWTKPNFTARAEKLLRWHYLALDWNPNYRDSLTLPEIIGAGASYSEDINQINRLNRILLKQGYLEKVRTSGNDVTIVSSAGVLHVEDLVTEKSNSSSAFVAMWFDKGMDAVWSNGFEPGLREIGYDPVRVDQIEHIGRIDDEIMNQIRRSRFLVADFTGHRGGVYFESGYALGLGLPVIWTCRDDDIENLHFDIRQYNNIVWKSPNDLRRRLRARVENVIGRGPRIK